MIIEWIGCSGTGKTTLCKEVYTKLLASGVLVSRPLEVFLGNTFAKAISNERLQNILLDFLVLPWTILSAVKYRRFLAYCFKALNKKSFSFALRIKLIRSILRKMGLHIFLNIFCNQKQLVLVDEGTIHIAHLLFANGDKNCVSKKEIEKFCELVPTPDLIVHIMAPKSEVIKRTLNRKHKPIPETSPDSLEHFINLGLEIFKILDDLNPWTKKTITFSNPENTFENRNGIAINITNKILDTFLSFKNE